MLLTFFSKKLLLRSFLRSSRYTEAQSNRIRKNLIVTMILVCAFFAVTWAPTNIYYLLMNSHLPLILHANSFSAILAIGFVYMSANPFIYAAKFDPVKRELMRLIPCKKEDE